MYERFTQIKQFKAVEGIASDIRQARTTVISDGAYWGSSYECLFRLSGTPVALRVNSPIFIEDGENIRVVGRHNRNGVFDAVAYCNRSSGVSSNLDSMLILKIAAIGIAIIGGILAIIGIVLFVLGGLLLAAFLYSVSILLGVGLVLVGWIMFVRTRSEIRMIEKLLSDKSDDLII